MSFDEEIKRTWCIWLYVSIPFEQGDVFRRTVSVEVRKLRQCLNPFRTGRCLSTEYVQEVDEDDLVSIPFEQGDVFRQENNYGQL